MKKIISIVAALVLFAGCSEPPSEVAREVQIPADQGSPARERGPKTGKCTTPSVTPITIQVTNGEIQVSPKKPWAYRGDVLQFNVPANVKEIVYVGGKNWDAEWIIEKSTKGADKFFVCVDPGLNLGDPPEDKTYYYFVLIPSIGYLDPEVIVKGRK